MKIYFWAEESFALYYDGVFKADVRGNYIDDDFYPCNVFAVPHSGKRAVGFFLSPKLSPPTTVRAYCLDDGFFVALKFTHYEAGGYKLLTQKRVGGVLITAVKRGYTEITVENATHVQTLSAGISEQFDFTVKGDAVFIRSLDARPYIAAVNRGGELTVLFSKIVDGVEFTPLFRTKTRYFDLEGTVTEVTHDGIGQGLGRASLTFVRNTTVDLTKREILRQVLLERLLIGTEVDSILSPGMRRSSGKLRQFLGGYHAILPSFCSKKGTYLCYKSKDRCHAKLFDVQIKDGLIDNLIEV